MSKLSTFLKPRTSQLAYATGLCVYTLLIIVEFVAVLQINNGVFVYTLDDPYIHLALAENIAKGHYGINLGEYSAPSSSILWPFLLAPFSFSPLSPLIINFIFGLGLVLIFVKAAEFLAQETNLPWTELVKALLVFLLILCTNLVGLVFIGMEHTLQVLLVSMIAYGLLLENRTSEARQWLLIIVVLAPLVRYENMAISAAALLYLADRGHRKEAALAGCATVVLLLTFSLFLLTHNLGFLPTSVNAKLNPRGDVSSLESIFLTLLINHGERQALVLLLGIFVINMFLFRSREAENSQTRPLLLATVAAVLLHFLFGKTNWYNRYEIYIWAFFLLILLYSIVTTYLSKSHTSQDFRRSAAIVVGIIFLLPFASLPYLTSLVTLPIASNNIYQQHYQMSKLVTDYYKRPVAVNDIGYVAYRNDYYVLDLFGLASEQALEFRQSRTDSDWMEQMLEERDIELAMIYDEWFPNVPDSWTPLGQLEIGGKRISAGYERVSFYATQDADLDYIRSTLNNFSGMLPAGTSFRFQ